MPLVRTALRGLASEPLVHFAILGGLLFALDAVVADDSAAEPAVTGVLATPTGPIVVDAALRAELVEQWNKTHAAPPDAAQLEQLVERWIDQEVLYREGLARSLAEGDSVVRDRIASQMAYVLRSRFVVPDPTEEDLRAALDANATTRAPADRIDFTQVFVAGTDEAAQTRAQELLRQLDSGADPDGLGDTFSGGRRFRGRRIDDLATRFGEAFVQGIEAQAEGTWSLRRSPEGFHLVRIDRRSVAGDQDLEIAKRTARHDWQEAQRDAAMRRELTELRGQWEIVVTP